MYCLISFPIPLFSFLLILVFLKFKVVVTKIHNIKETKNVREQRQPTHTNTNNDNTKNNDTTTNNNDTNPNNKATKYIHTQLTN